MITHRLEWSVIVAAMLLTSPAARASARSSCWPPRTDRANTSPTIVRSCWRSAFATVQPAFTPPMTSRASARTSSKKTSQKGDAPEMSLIGFVVTPGDAMSTRMKEIPSCFRAPGSVRTRQKIQSLFSA